MSVFIFSAIVTLDKPYIDKTSIPKIGFYPSVENPNSPTPPATIKWCESNINNSSYASIIIEVGDADTSINVDCPVVQKSEVQLTLNNIHKIHLLLLEQEISLINQKINIYIDEFDPDTGEKIGASKLYFCGNIYQVNYNEEEFFITCENNKDLRKSKVIKDGELFTVGATSEIFSPLFATKRITPIKEVLTFNTNKFQIVGRETYVGNGYGSAIKRSYYYYVLFRTPPLLNMPDYGESFDALIGAWMHVIAGSGDSNGQYRKVISAVRSHCPDTPYTGTGFDNFNEYGSETSIVKNWFFKIEVEGLYTTPLEPDLLTWVEFVSIKFEYEMSKFQVDYNPDQLYIKDKNNKYSRIISDHGVGNYYDYINQLSTDKKKLIVTPSKIVDEKTIITYTVKTCNNLQPINDSTLGLWQFTKPDDTLFGKFYGLVKAFSAYDDGFYYQGGEIGQQNFVFENINYAFTRVLDDQQYARYYHKIKCSMSAIVAFEYSLPEVPDNFTFKNAYLGMVIESKCSKGVKDLPIKALARTEFGKTDEIVSIPLSQENGGLISNTPYWMYLTYYPTHYYAEDFEEDYSTISTDNKKFTNYKKFKLKCETVEEYRDIYKIGLFFPRDKTDSFIEDEIKIHMLCVIFEHENDISEVFV